MLSELLYADELVLKSATFVGLRNKFIELKAFYSKDLNDNLGKTEVMLYGGTTNDGLSKSNVM